MKYLLSLLFSLYLTQSVIAAKIELWVYTLAVIEQRNIQELEPYKGYYNKHIDEVKEYLKLSFDKILEKQKLDKEDFLDSEKGVKLFAPKK